MDSITRFVFRYARYPSETECDYLVYDRRHPNWPGKFKFDTVDHEREFLRLYSECVRHGKPMYILENRRTDITPVTIDVDSPADFKLLVEYITDALNTYFTFNKVDGVVLTRPKSDKGFHVQFDAWMTVTDWKLFVDVLRSKPDGTCIDSNIKRCSWFLLGSHKDPTNTGVYEIINRFNIDVSDGKSTVNFNHVMSDFNEDDLTRWSIRRLNQQVPLLAKKQELPSPMSMTTVDCQFVPNASLSKLAHVLSRLSSYRSNSYDDWFSVMRVIHDETNGSLEGLSLFKRFSMRCSKYNENACVDRWNNYKRGSRPYTIGVLFKMINDDNTVSRSREYEPCSFPGCIFVGSHARLHAHYQNHIWKAKQHGEKLSDPYVNPERTTQCKFCR